MSLWSGSRQKFDQGCGIHVHAKYPQTPFEKELLYLYCVVYIKVNINIFTGQGGAVHVIGARAERAENRLEWSGAVSGVQKINWSVSGAGAGGRRSGNGSVSGTYVNGAER